MKDRNYLGVFEQIILLAILRLGENAYGVTIRQEIQSRTGRPVSIGAIYTTLDRLERKGFVKSWLANPTPARGGRAKRYFKLDAPGASALKDSHRVFKDMWEGIKPIVEVA